jgi:hypothetical protein
MSTDWVSIITAVGGVLSGGGAVAFRNWRINRRREMAEAKQVEAQAKQSEAQATDTAVEALNRAIDTLQEERSHDRGIIDKLTGERERLTNDKIALINKMGAMKVCMCVHLGCVMRKPTQGQADKWMEDHADEELYGADYAPVNVLLRRLKSDGDGND